MSNERRSTDRSNSENKMSQHSCTGAKILQNDIYSTSSSQDLSEGLCKKFILGFNHILNPT